VQVTFVSVHRRESVGTFVEKPRINFINILRALFYADIFSPKKYEAKIRNSVIEKSFVKHFCANKAHVKC